MSLFRSPNDDYRFPSRILGARTEFSKRCSPKNKLDKSEKKKEKKEVGLKAAYRALHPGIHRQVL